MVGQQLLVWQHVTVAVAPKKVLTLFLP